MRPEVQILSPRFYIFLIILFLTALFFSCSKSVYKFSYPLKEGKVNYTLSAKVNSIVLVKSQDFYLDYKLSKNGYYKVYCSNGFLPYEYYIFNSEKGLYLFFDSKKYLLIPSKLKKGYKNKIDFKGFSTILYLSFDGFDRLDINTKKVDVFVFSFRLKGYDNIEGKAYVSKKYGLLKFLYTSKKSNSNIKVVWKIKNM